MFVAMRSALLVCTLFFSLSPQALELAPYTAHYKSTYKGFSASAEHQFVRLANGNYEQRTRAKIFVFGFKEVGTLKLEDKRVYPLTYKMEGKGVSDKDMTLNFDWKNALVSNSGGDEQWQIPLSGPTYDKLSQYVQLRVNLLSQGTEFENTSFPVVDIKRIKEYKNTVIGEEVIDTPAGKITCIKIEEQRPGKDKKTILWFAKEWEYLLVKLERIKRGKLEYSLLLDKATVGERKVSGS